MPEELQRVGDLEIEQDLRMQQWQWRFQRAGWLAIVLLIVAAALGLCGRGGPLDTGTIGAPGDPITLEYSRFARRDAPFHLTVTLRPELAGPEGLELWLSDDYLSRVQIERVSPGHTAVIDRGAWTVYRFERADDVEDPLVVEFRFSALGAGLLSGEVRSATADAVDFRQFIYP